MKFIDVASNTYHSANGRSTGRVITNWSLIVAFVGSAAGVAAFTENIPTVLRSTEVITFFVFLRFVGLKISVFLNY